MAIAAAFLFGGGAEAPAQEALCQDPNGYCTPMLAAICVRTLGAGAIALPASGGPNCAQQRKEYMQCIGSAAQLCSPIAPEPQHDAAGGCSAEDARALWTELKESFYVEDLDGFADMCAGRPQSMLAANRAKRIRDGVISAAREPAFNGQPIQNWERIEAEAHLARLGLLSGGPDGAWDASDSEALQRYQRNAGLPIAVELDRPSLESLRARPAPPKEALGVSLNGSWTGSYGYDDPRPEVAFRLQLADKSGDLIGRSDEPQTFGNSTAAGMLHADWKGKISSEGLLAFVKTYDGTGGQTHSISYTGKLVGRNRIEGRWSINSRTNGYFHLTR